MNTPQERVKNIFEIMDGVSSSTTIIIIGYKTSVT